MNKRKIMAPQRLQHRACYIIENPKIKDDWFYIIFVHFPTRSFILTSNYDLGIFTVPPTIPTPLLLGTKSKQFLYNIVCYRYITVWEGSSSLIPLGSPLSLVYLAFCQNWLLSSGIAESGGCSYVINTKQLYGIPSDIDQIYDKQARLIEPFQCCLAQRTAS